MVAPHMFSLALVQKTQSTLTWSYTIFPKLCALRMITWSVHIKLRKSVSALYSLQFSKFDKYSSYLHGNITIFQIYVVLSLWCCQCFLKWSLVNRLLKGYLPSEIGELSPFRHEIATFIQIQLILWWWRHLNLSH